MRILSVVAFATCACLVSQSSEAQTGKGLSQSDVSKINEATQTWVKAALGKDWATVAALYLDDAGVCAPSSLS